MPCLECGNPKTCRAHIIPAALGKDIIRQEPGLKALSLLEPNRINNYIQSGLFDDDILCSYCDGRLNVFDDHAIEILPIQLEQAAQPLREAGGHGGRRRAGCLSLADRR